MRSHANTNGKRAGALLAAAGLTLGALVLPTAAANAAGSVAGKTCAVSGMVKNQSGAIYVCKASTGGKLTWAKGATVSKGKATLSVMNGWAKAANTTEGAMMSGAFGMVKNTSSASVRVIAATSPYSKAVQLHEVVMKDGAMVMQEKAGGFAIPAGGMLELKPGGNHLMFVGLKKSIVAGTSIPVTLITSNGKKITVSLLAKEFNGGNEEYDGGGHGGGM